MSTLSSSTVRFNVGGQPFQVSRSLILEQWKHTILAVMVSERWQEDPESIIFIDRDGEHFRHVLNYLRYGSVSLPLTISKEDFMQDMDFYGILVTEGSIEETRFVSMQTMVQAITEGNTSLQTAADAVARGGEALATATRGLAQLGTVVETAIRAIKAKHEGVINASAEAAFAGTFLAWMVSGSALGLMYGAGYVIDAFIFDIKKK